MKLSLFGRTSLACVVSLAVLLGMTACGGGTIGFMWVLAGKSASNASGNSITGFKIDNFTGNLTEIVKSPFTSGGVNPAMLVVKPGGRYVYVANAGDGTSGSSNITQFSVGGDGVLSSQQTYFSQGTSPVWIQIDSTGNFLYVLDQQARLPAATPANPSPIPTGCTVANCGAVTVFSIAPDTGRLTLVTNTTVKDAGGTFITYFPVGPKPRMMRYLTAGYLLTVNGDNTIFSYAANATNGQLALTTNSTQIISSGLPDATPVNITSITSGGQYVYLTDSNHNSILPYTISNGVLQTLTGGTVLNLAPNVTPVWTLTDASGVNFYVLNSNSQNSTTAASSISAYRVLTDGKLQPVSGSGNPYPVGSGPVCMVEDPVNKYVYTSNANDSTVTGFEIRKETGELNALRRGSSFQVTGKPTCLAVSPNVS